MRIMLFLLLSFPVVMASLIDVTVDDVINFDLIGFNYNNSKNLVNVSFEAFNSGSVGCNALFRLDVEGDDYKFTGWSEKYIYQPNDRKFLDIYWFSLNKTGNFNAKLRYYCANEVKEVKEFGIKINEFSNKEPTIEIISPKFFENKITLNIKTNSPKDVILIVDSPKGWVIHQKKIHTSNNWPKYVEIEYSKDMWRSDKISIFAVGTDGEYGIKEIEIKKEPMINQMFFDLTIYIRVFLDKIL